MKRLWQLIGMILSASLFAVCYGVTGPSPWVVDKMTKPERRLISGLEMTITNVTTRPAKAAKGKRVFQEQAFEKQVLPVVEQSLHSDWQLELQSQTQGPEASEETVETEYPLLKNVPGSTKTYTESRIDDFNPPDWFPEEHPPMPPVVQHGNGKSVRACAYCHLASGLGYPQSANLTGLSVSYMMGQLADFKSGARKAPAMPLVAQDLSENDLRQAADWFASLKPSVWIKVVETDSVPKSFIYTDGTRLPLTSGATEPLGNRVIELPQDPSRTLSQDPHSGFIAYVPVGSIAKGETLVVTGGAGRTTPCAICHGQTLKGLGDVPKIAGRSPSYIFRQIRAIQRGERAGVGAELMKPVVANLNEDDIVAIAAYVSSRAP
jgi:cytochrome c553